jgi:hypothetical protein
MLDFYNIKFYFKLLQRKFCFKNQNIFGLSLSPVRYIQRIGVSIVSYRSCSEFSYWQIILSSNSEGGGVPPKSIYYLEGNPNVVFVGTYIKFKIFSGNSVCGPPP